MMELNKKYDTAIQIEKKKIEIELFYSANNDGKYDLNEYDRNDLDIFVMGLSGIIDTDAFRSIHSDFCFTPGKTNVNSFMIESEITDELKAVLEVQIKISILDDSLKKRLMELGYDEKEAALKHRGNTVRRFNCGLCDSKLSYDYELDDFLDHIEHSAEKMLIEFRNKESLYFIKNETYRKWLMELKGWYIDHDDIIISAPIDISEKVKILKDIENDERRKKHRAPDLTFEALIQYETALKLISENSPVSAYVLNEYHRVNEKDKPVKNRITTHRTFQQVRDAIAEKYHGEEPNEFADRWNIVDRYDLKDGNYAQVAKFLVSEKGNIWHVKCKNVTFDWYGHSRPASVRFVGLDLPAPYKSGDIIAIDRRPFNEPYHVLIIEESEGEYNSSPYCLRKTREGVELNWCEFFEFDFFGISPFFSMELYEGELSEDEKILGELSKRIRNNEDFLGEIYKVVELNKPEDAEKKLWEVLAEK